MSDQPSPPRIRMEPSPRDDHMETAGKELFAWVQEFRARYGLTAFEFLYLMSVLTGRLIQYACIAEREGVLPKTDAPQG